MAKNGDGLYTRDPNSRKYTFPERLNFDKEPFATVIPGRASGTFKVHKTEGLANSALSHHGEGAKYKQENGVWVKVWEFYEPEDCESCGTLLNSERDKKRNVYGSTKWYRSPLHRGSHIFAPFLCKNCHDKEEQVVDDREKAKRWRAEEKRRAQFDANN